MSWKQYGGSKNLEMNKKMTTNTIIADEIVLKNSYIGGFTIRGILDVTGKATIQGNLEIFGLISTADISLGQIHVYDKSYFYGKSFFYSDISASNDAIIGNTILVNNDAIVKNNMTVGNILYLNTNLSKYVFSNNNGIGINKINPTASLDISCSRIEGLNIISDFSKNTNIISSNKDKRGVVITTSNVDDSSNNTNVHFDFYTNKDINVNEKGDAYLKYKDNGVFEINATKKISSLSNFAVTNRPEEKYDNIFNETLVIYDNSNSIHDYNIYKNNAAITGDAISIVTTDNSSNSFFRIVTPQKTGLGIMGGAYPNDTSRSMAGIGITDISGNYTPNQIIISGNNINKYNSSLGINTYKPKVDNYVVDINGPVHIDNGDIHIVNISDFEIISMNASKINPNCCMAVGSSLDISSVVISNTTGYKNSILISNDYGSTWVLKDITTYLINISIPIKNYKLNDVFVYDSSFAFIVGTYNLLLYTRNGGYSWGHFVFTNVYDFKNIVINKLVDDILNFFITGFDFLSNHVFIKFSKNGSELSNGDTISILNNQIYSYTFSSDYIVNSFDVSLNQPYFATNKGICTIPLSNQFTTITNTSSYIYNSIKIQNKIIAVGNGISSVSTNGINFTNSNISTNLKKLWVYDSLHFLSISTNSIFYTIDGGINWTTIPLSYLNTSGKSEFITDISNVFTNIIMSDSNTILLSKTIQTYVQNSSYGKSSIINCFLPNLFNRINNNVLDVCGNMIISGDFSVNDGGKILSNNDTFYLLNENVKNLHFAENASNITIGNIVSGNTTINTNLNVFRDINANEDLHVNGRFYIDDVDNIVIRNSTLSEKFVSIETNQQIRGIKNFTQTTIMSNTTDSTNTSSGALVVSGGVGISKNLNVGTIVKANSILVNNIGIGRQISSYSLDISGDTNINGNIIVNNVYTKGIYSNNDLYVFSGNIDIGQYATTINTGKNASIINIGQNNDTTFTNNINIGSFGVNGNSYITIGGYNDIIKMNGELTLPTTVKQFYALVQYSKQATFFLKEPSGNQQAFMGGIVDECGNNILSNSGTENGGIMFYDLSQNGLGYFLITDDYDGYKFKAPTYKSFADYNSDPSRNRQNILKLDINNLKTTANNAIVILRKSTNLSDSKYTVSGTNFDISNIFVKDVDTSYNTQSISTKVIFNNSVSINKQNNINNTILDVNGNAIISRLGIGTSSVNPNQNSLEIQGNVYQSSNGYIYQF